MAREAPPVMRLGNIPTVGDILILNGRKLVVRIVEWDDEDEELHMTAVPYSEEIVTVATDRALDAGFTMREHPA